MFSQTVEYALRAMVYLAMQSPSSRTTEEIAEATRVPRAYLAKVLQSLSRGRLIQTQRGIGGGISLSRGPGEISILEVVNAVDPIERIASCPLKIASHGRTLCPLHRRLDHALEMVEQAFGSTTLDQLLNQADHPKPLCEAVAEA